MADNVELDIGSGGATVAADDISSVWYQRVKLTDGTANSTTPINVGNGVAANALRVTLASDGTGVVALSATDNAVLDTIDAVLDAINAKLVTGTVIGDVNLGATDNAVLDAIDAVLDTIKIDTEAIETAVEGTLTVDGSGVTQPVSGTVTANLSATDNAVLDTIDAVLDTINAKLVTGTVIGDVNLGATDNAVLDAIDTVLDTINAKLVTGTVIGDVNLGATDNAVIDDIAAKLAPHTTNGATPYLNQDTSAIDAVKGSAGTIYWITCVSTDATPVYLNLYDSTSATLGSTTPTNQFIVPSQGDANGAGFTINFGPFGIQYSTGIQVAAATTYNGSTDPGTNVVITNIGFE